MSPPRTTPDQKAARRRVGLPEPLRSHLRRLGLGSTQEYLQWCGVHGFKRTLDKRSSQLLAEVELRRSQTRGRVPRATKPKGKVPRRVKAQDRLLAHVRRVRPGMRRLDGFAEAVAALVGYCRAWRRPVEEWQPEGGTQRECFARLTRHVLALWPVPAQMDSVWFDRSDEAERWQRLFVHIGSGKNPRTADLPIAYTKKMAHHFLQAPSHYSVPAALRHGQVLGLGGTPRLADALRETRLGREFANDDFWVTVVRFFIRHSLVESTALGEILDYIHDQRFEPRQEPVRDGSGQVVERPPPHPGFTMKGRSAPALLRESEVWHREQVHRDSYGERTWPHSEFRDYCEPVHGEECALESIRELLSSAELHAEGREMRHCVASYASRCWNGRSSIWSMERLEGDEATRLLTIEVALGTRAVVHASGRCNRRPEPSEVDTLRAWAQREQLDIESWVV